MVARPQSERKQGFALKVALPRMFTTLLSRGTQLRMTDLWVVITAVGMLLLIGAVFGLLSLVFSGFVLIFKILIFIGKGIVWLVLLPIRLAMRDA